MFSCAMSPAAKRGPPPKGRSTLKWRLTLQTTDLPIDVRSWLEIAGIAVLGPAAMMGVIGEDVKRASRWEKFRKVWVQSNPRY